MTSFQALNNNRTTPRDRLNKLQKEQQGSSEHTTKGKMGGSQWSMEGEGQSQGEKEETGGSQEKGQGAEGHAIPAEEQG